MTVWILLAVVGWLLGSIPLALFAGKVMGRISKDYDRVAYGPQKNPVRLP